VCCMTPDVGVILCTPDGSSSSKQSTLMQSKTGRVPRLSPGSCWGAAALSAGHTAAPCRPYRQAGGSTYHI
jgi:hypothetical protein